MEKRISFDSAAIWEESAAFSIAEDGQLCISVKEEHYEMLACEVHLSPDQTRNLRDWLSAVLES